MLTVTLEVDTIIFTILQMRKQRGTVARDAQSQAAMKGGARLPAQVN